MSQANRALRTPTQDLPELWLAVSRRVPADCWQSGERVEVVKDPTENVAESSGKHGRAVRDRIGSLVLERLVLAWIEVVERDATCLK